MQLTFLGTGTSQGIPVIGSNHPVGLSKDSKDKRLRTSALVRWGDKQICIDCSPDFRQQMLNQQVTHLEGILFTHEHADHTAGLDDIRPLSQKADMPIFALPRVMQALRQRFAYIFATENRYAGAPSVLPTEIEDTPFDFLGKKIIPIQIQHGTLPILGYRIENLAYITDAKSIHESEIEKLKGIHTLVINALRGTPHPTHLSLSEAFEIIKKIAPEKTYLTHISQDMGFHSEVQKQLPRNIFLAYDNLQIQIP